jgi:hypothetical protein
LGPTCGVETVRVVLDWGVISVVAYIFLCPRAVIRIGWVMEKSVEAHLSRIQNHLAKGRDILRSLLESNLTTYELPDVVSDTTILRLRPPEDTDRHDLSLFPRYVAVIDWDFFASCRYYLATDERDPDNLAYVSDRGAILLSDLLTIEDRRAFGWPLMISDVLGLVEQAMLSRADYFYAHALSSFAGGAINMRGAAGLDPRTAEID